MYISFFRSSVDEHLGYFYVLADVNLAAVNTGVQVSFYWDISSLQYCVVSVVQHCELAIGIHIASPS